MYPPDRMNSTFPVLALSEPKDLVAHLRDLGWIKPSEEVESVVRAGEGNMNLVARVTTSGGGNAQNMPTASFIFKQSRPWVEKYPQIPAPADRILIEVGFYRAVLPYGLLAGMMPALLAVDTASRCAKMEDLGASSDCTDIYSGVRRDLAPLVDWLSRLHGTEFSAAAQSQLRNREMRALNHAHIFDLPISGKHGLHLDDFTPGLEDVAQQFRQHPGLAKRVSALGQVYLADGDRLLHGDFYPGSWLSTSQGLRVIDPEFCFFGPAEFDLGVLRAHLAFADYDDTRIDSALSGYSQSIDPGLCRAFEGVEILRRLIGVAQLPFQRSLAQKAELLERAKTSLDL